MRALIHFIRRGPAGAVEQRDKVYDGDLLTLGRATDQVVQFKDRRVALSHAEIVMRSGQPVLVSRVPGGVLVNGIIQREARLKPGDEISIGANLLRVQVPADNFDLVFSFELDPEARAEALVAELPRLRLTEIGHGKRRWSWLLFAGVLLLALGIPATGIRSPTIQETLRGGPLPDDHFWSPGSLSRVHQALEVRCDACHTQPFRRVRNNACLACHESSLHRHTSPGTIKAGVVPAASRTVAALDTVRCASCHSEHHEPGILVREEPTVCTQCHADLTTEAPWTAVAAQVTDFATDHPDFTVPDREDSGLKFPHSVHLAQSGVRSPVGDTVLGCGDCHVLEPGGARFQPVRMERDCSGCHLLDFDPAYPSRNVPHGDATAVGEFLVDYYSRRFLESYADPLGAPTATRRIGRRPGAAERERLLRDAREKAAVVTRDLFERRSCVECHDIADQAGSAGGPAVRPVAARAAWLPAATFSHAAHSTTLTACDTCHDAARSEAAADVLLPTIATCRECHAGGNPGSAPTGRVASSCVLCHSFHEPQNPLWPGGAMGQ
jgi:predicted CXXCH cytochrome family protein